MHVYYFLVCKSKFVLHGFVHSFLNISCRNFFKGKSSQGIPATSLPIHLCVVNGNLRAAQKSFTIRPPVFL